MSSSADGRSADRAADTDVQGLGRGEDQMPDPSPPGKPDSLGDMEKRSWKYVLRKTVREFTDDECTDRAAALTYYAVLAIFPAALALTSILGLVGQADRAVQTILDVLRPLVAESTISAVEPVLRGMTQSQAAGLTFVIGLLGALWSASAYVAAFSRAMNNIYEIDEGRPFWKLRPFQILLTLVAIVFSALVLVMLIISGPLATSIGEQLGLGSAAVTAWRIAKWPVLGLLVVLVVAMLYYATPNVKQPKFRWMSVGAAVAIVVWVLASVGFAFYVANFSNYQATYGSIAGVIVALLWLWITNVALLFGAEIDSELERGRQLEAGIPAEEELKLPVRDTSNIEKAYDKEQKDIKMGRQIRRQADPDGVVAAKYSDNNSRRDEGRD